MFSRVWNLITERVEIYSWLALFNKEVTNNNFDDTHYHYSHIQYEDNYALLEYSDVVTVVTFSSWSSFRRRLHL